MTLARSAVAMICTHLLALGSLHAEQSLLQQLPAVDAVSFTAPAVQASWKDLFAVKGRSADQAVIGVGLIAQGRLPLLARLLYDGPPGGDSKATQPAQTKKNKVRWEARTEAVQAAILRYMRFDDDPALLAVYEQYLRTPRSDSLVTSVLMNAWHSDPTAAVSLYERLVDPNHQAVLASAQDPVVRQAATEWAIEKADDYPRLANRAVAFALLHGSVDERLLATRAIGKTGFVPQRIIEFVRATVANKTLADLALDDREVLATLLAACSVGAVDDAFGQELVAFVHTGARDVACAAAGALLKSQVALQEQDIAALRQRAQKTTDVTIRNVILAVLAAHAPDAARTEAGPGNPWSILSTHREAMRDWK